ncbi:vWA domain-containing protein [Catenovulum sediminis]|uniref:vWA domain-containing protein n=1 Tax=Catenovulum sediminis TaxID=1740262 RepID=UPI00117F001C|nr:VWA domain-containing protein [Catenovulum sediminis]
MADFHFLRPYWFLALIPVLVLGWMLFRYKISQSGWTQFIPPHLATHLINQKNTNSSLPIKSIIIAWLIAVIALAGPTWQKRPQPIFQAKAGKVILLDLSLSMYAEDIRPNRMTMARFKAIEIARNINEGDLGLVGYAGDAFTISPLTPDSNNIVSLIPSLSPDIMPVKGSDAALGILQAIELLKNAGFQNGDIFWITDGVSQVEVNDINQYLLKEDYKLLILGVGTEEGAPIKLPSDELLKDRNGSIVIPKMNSYQLRALADKNSGIYQAITADDQDINNLIANMQTPEEIEKDNKTQLEGDQWFEFGPWLVVAILPFALLAFRKGAMMVICLAIFFPVLPNSAHANLLDSAWQNNDQRAYQLLQEGQYQEAIELAEDSNIKGAAHFKNGDYEKAVAAYANSKDPDALYNKGNALANLGKLDEAIEAYEEALAQRPDFQKAAQNKQLAEQLKKQQQQQQQEQQQQNNDKNSEQEDPEQQNQDGQSQQGDQQSQNDEQQSSGQQEQEQENSGNNTQNNDQQSPSANDDEAQNDQENAANQTASYEQQEQQDEQNSTQQMLDNAKQQAENAEQTTEQAMPTQMTEEQREEQENQQIIQQLLNKVEDDPSFLLRRKMQLEYEKRRRQQTPKGVKEPW